MQKLKIHIVTANENDWDEKYILYRLTRLWDAAGHETVIGPEVSDDADIYILHFNQTWIDVESIPDIPKNRHLVNEPRC